MEQSRRLYQPSRRRFRNRHVDGEMDPRRRMMSLPVALSPAVRSCLLGFTVGWDRFKFNGRDREAFGFLEGSLPAGINTPLGILHLPIHSTKPLLCRIFSRAPAVLTPFAAFKPTRPATPVSLLPPFLISSVSFFFLSPAVVFAAASPNAPRERAENALSLPLPASSRRGGWRGPTLRAPSKPPDLALSLRGLRRCLS